jgi:hypothetical protein
LQQTISLIATVAGNQTYFDDYASQVDVAHLYYIASCNQIGVGLLSKPEEGYRGNEAREEKSQNASKNNEKDMAQVETCPATSGNNMDFDGDGIDELISFDRSSGELKIRSFCSAFSFVVRTPFAGDDFVVLPGDYDGDMKNDVALYERETGEWHILFHPVDGFYLVTFRWGGKGFAVVPPSDYDGDGCTDLALYEFLDGKWYIKKIDGTMLVGND